MDASHIVLPVKNTRSNSHLVGLEGAIVDGTVVGALNT